MLVFAGIGGCSGSCPTGHARDAGAAGAASEAGTSSESASCSVPADQPGDATPAIQHCIDQMGALGGGAVFLVGGQYSIDSDHLRFQKGKHDNVRLSGAGTTTVLRLKPGLAKSAILIGSDGIDLSDSCIAGSTDVAVTGIEIDSLRIVGNLGNPLDCCPVDSAAWHDCELYAGSTVLTRNGITIRCAANVTISNVAIESTNSGGIVADHAYKLLVENAEITSPLVDCFASNFTEGTVVRNVTCNAPGWSGFNADPATNLTFDGNKVNGSGTFYRCPDTPWERPGIYARGVLGSTIVRNLVTSSSGVGIYLSGASSNVISDNQVANSTKVGIVLDYNPPATGGCVNGSSDNLLTGNEVTGGSDYAVWAVCPSLGNVASANVCSGNGKPGVFFTSQPSCRGACDCGATCADPSKMLQITDGTCTD
jgi:parallel beta-helix repeat protein